MSHTQEQCKRAARQLIAQDEMEKAALVLCYLIQISKQPLNPVTVAQQFACLETQVDLKSVDHWLSNLCSQGLLGIGEPQIVILKSPDELG